eukprot:jgi/Bigna1/147360/aug1.143_g22068
MSALLFGALAGEEEACHILLQNGADPNLGLFAPDIAGQQQQQQQQQQDDDDDEQQQEPITPLWAAVQMGLLSVVKAMGKGGIAGTTRQCDVLHP